MTTIYELSLYVPKYVNNKSLNDLSLVNKYWMLVTKEHRLLRYAKKLGWEELAKIGYLEGIKLLHKYNIEGCTIDAMDWASRNGHLDIVKWLHENRTEGSTANAMYYASQYGHLDVVEYLKSIGTLS